MRSELRDGGPHVLVRHRVHGVYESHSMAVVVYPLAAFVMAKIIMHVCMWISVIPSCSRRRPEELRVRHLPYEKVQFVLVGPGAPHTFRPYPLRVIASPPEAYPVLLLRLWQVVNAKQVFPSTRAELSASSSQSFRSRPARSAFDLSFFSSL
jgi:hypothetical protein